MKTTAILILFVAAAGCDNDFGKPPKPPPRTEVPAHEACDMPKVAEFVIECSRVSNTKSDEEGEDVVLECHRVALSSFCTEECERWPSRVKCFHYRGAPETPK